MTAALIARFPGDFMIAVSVGRQVVHSVPGSVKGRILYIYRPAFKRFYMKFRTMFASEPGSDDSAEAPQIALSPRSVSGAFASAYRRKSEEHTEFISEKAKLAAPLAVQEAEKNWETRPRTAVSDDKEVEAACELALHECPGKVYENVRVLVSGGRVMLRGTVGSGADRWAAEMVVNSLAGVTGVNSQIRVNKAR